MKSVLTVGVIGSVLFYSCSSNDEKKIIKVEHHDMFKNEVAVKANRALTIQIAGMTCEHACGGSIRTSLKETKAVERCSFKSFDAEKEFNTAYITFDKAKISVDKIVEIIENTNNHQFKTKNPSSQAILETSETTIESSASESNSSIEVASAEIQFPSIRELFTRLID